MAQTNRKKLEEGIKVKILKNFFILCALVFVAISLYMIWHKQSSVSIQKAFSYAFDYDYKSDSGDFKIPKIAPWKGKKLVVIDPGHGGVDPGATTENILEKDITLDICLKLNAILKDEGIYTYLTRSTDATMRSKDRIYLANEKNAALFVSIHIDSIDNKDPNGMKVLYYPSKELYSGFLSEMDYANILKNNLSKIFEIKNKGIFPREDIFVLKHAKMPSLVIEAGFLSNENDSQILSFKWFKNKLASVIANGIKESLKKID